MKMDLDQFKTRLRKKVDAYEGPLAPSGEEAPFEEYWEDFAQQVTEDLPDEDEGDDEGDEEGDDDEGDSDE